MSRPDPDAINACAAIVERSDPDRFAAAMATPPAARAALFPLYAFNVEVARAPWVTSEPMLAQIRLQWWRDALDEIAAGGTVRRHEVATPLADVLDPVGASGLAPLLDARLSDIEAVPFADWPPLVRYLEATGGTLMWAAGHMLGAPDPDALRARGRIGALARYLMAVPGLVARGRKPLPADGAAGAGRLAARWRGEWRRLPRPRGAGRHAALEAWQAPAILRNAAADPHAITDGRLAPSEFRRRAGLLLAAAWG